MSCAERLCDVFRLNAYVAASGRGHLRVVHDDRDGTAVGGNQRDAGITGHKVGV